MPSSATAPIAAIPARVARLGRAAAEGLIAGGVAPVMKHIPGHGRARADSHLELPIVEAGREELERVDFAPFTANADLPMAMTAHVVYTAIDPERARHAVEDRSWARSSAAMIGFDGLLMTDDLSMKALTGSFRERAERAIARGLRHGPALQRRSRRGARRSPKARARSPARRWRGPKKRWNASEDRAFRRRRSDARVRWGDGRRRLSAEAIKAASCQPFSMRVSLWTARPNRPPRLLRRPKRTNLPVAGIKPPICNRKQWRRN